LVSGLPVMSKMNDECGRGCVTPKNSRIVGGVQALAHSWPWQGSVRYRGHNWRHWCGCSVISSQWVITAAHCMYVQSHGPVAASKLEEASTHKNAKNHACNPLVTRDLDL